MSALLFGIGDLIVLRWGGRGQRFGPSDYGSEGWGFESLRARNRNGP
jgi:hypothetical protein